MKDIAIYGAGGFGREIACFLNTINKHEPMWNLIGFFDDKPNLKDSFVSHFAPCLGGIEELNAYPKELALVVSTGKPKSIKSIVEKITNPNIFFPNLIHPDVVICDPETFSIGKGNIIQTGCYFSTNVSVGDFNVFNGRNTYGHDTKVGRYNVFMPSVLISGGVTIGNCNLLGVGSIVIQKISIGDGVTLGAGSVLLTKPKAEGTYIGNPAKLFKF